MSKQTGFYDSLIRNIKLSLYVSAPAKVLKYNSGAHTASVQPLFLTVDSNDNVDDWPLVEDAPVLKHVGDLAPGNVVLLLFADRAIDNMHGADMIDPDSTRTHDLTDAFVIGVIQT
ncbi:Gp138 family membrane-puncturing spike protein [Sporolactobacillus pectinivorans]|uniref:Gp138 family membrane-puncturing spike protein n=1 Tax=Sporolactobacillus pectinivorans TaxID=1591408 RepID=UPI000C25D2A4|nr:Gp138 family membrane-puncturing spike protein [Sporolactobacillus pectinivorans]